MFLQSISKRGYMEPKELASAFSIDIIMYLLSELWRYVGMVILIRRGWILRDCALSYCIIC